MRNLKHIQGILCDLKIRDRGSLMRHQQCREESRGKGKGEQKKNSGRELQSRNSVELLTSRKPDELLTKNNDE